MKKIILIITITFVTCFSVKAQHDQIIYIEPEISERFPLAPNTPDIKIDVYDDYYLWLGGQLDHYGLNVTLALHKIHDYSYWSYGRIYRGDCKIGDTIYKFVEGWDYDVDWWGDHLPANYHEDHIVPFRYMVDDDYYYGWCEISVKFINKREAIGTFHRMAFCTVPNYPLRIGQTSFDWSVNEKPENEGINLMRQSDMLAIQAPKNINYIMIIDLMGRTLLTKEVNGNDKEEIDIANLSAGIYVIQVTTEDRQSYSIKFVK